MDLLYFLLALVAGLIVLIKSSDLFVEGSAQTATYFGMSQFLIGVLIVGFGTSAPEMLVSAASALDHVPALALGNAYGSNITNIALILGATALISPIIIDKNVLLKETPKLIISIVISFGLLWDGEISRVDGFILIIIFSILMIRMILLSQKNSKNNMDEKKAHENISIGKALSKVVIGITILVLSSKLMVWGAIGIAKYFNIKDLIIGLTIVAIGTSLPELAASITAARKGNNDLAIGNIIGSNLFNTYIVVGIAGAITPINSGSDVIYRDLPIMTLLTISIFIFGFPKKSLGGKGEIGRVHGIIWLLAYASYTTYLAYTSIG